jgi:FkbM family methyltransferase
MRTIQQTFKPLKRYLRKTWLYSAKSWFKEHTPIGSQQHQKMLTFYAQFVCPGDLCFDIGANVGNRTKVFVELGAKVICVEPQDVCLEHLDRLFSQNGNVTIVSKAVGNQEGTAELSICKEASTISTLSNQWKSKGRFADEFQWTRTQPVAVTTLNHLIELYGVPRFCKIDVEGFELSVLQGLTQPIPCLSFEFNMEFAGEAKECIRHLESISPVRLNCSVGESMEWHFMEWSTPDEFCQWIDLIEDKLFWCDVYARFI